MRERGSSPVKGRKREWVKQKDWKRMRMGEKGRGNGRRRNEKEGKLNKRKKPNVGKRKENDVSDTDSRVFLEMIRY